MEKEMEQETKKDEEKDEEKKEKRKEIKDTLSYKDKKSVKSTKNSINYEIMIEKN